MITNIFSWDLSVRLGYFVTIFTSESIKLYINSLGFERKARLFCDTLFISLSPYSILLGFERKARLFCDRYHDTDRSASNLVGI